MRRLVVPCKNEQLRDIALITERGSQFGYNFTKLSVKIRTTVLIARLLTEKMNRTINPRSIIAEEHFASVKNIVYDIHAHMMAYMAKINSTSIDAAMATTFYRSIPEDIKDRYCFFLERKVHEKCGLDFGRCKNMWCANALLQNATTDRSYDRHVVTQVPLIKEHVELCDGSCEIADSELAHMEGVPLSLLGNEGSNNNQDVKKVKEEPKEPGRVFGESNNVFNKQSSSKEAEKGDRDITLDKSERSQQNEEKETSSSSTIKVSTPNKIPVVIPADDDDEEDSDDDEDDYGSRSQEASTANKIQIVMPADAGNDDNDNGFPFQEETEHNNEKATTAASAIRSNSFFESVNNSNKRPNSYDSDESESQSKKKGKVSDCHQQ